MDKKVLDMKAAVEQARAKRIAAMQQNANQPKVVGPKEKVIVSVAIGKGLAKAKKAVTGTATAASEFVEGIGIGYNYESEFADAPVNVVAAAKELPRSRRQAVPA